MEDKEPVDAQALPGFPTVHSQPCPGNEISVQRQKDGFRVLADSRTRVGGRRETAGKLRALAQTFVYMFLHLRPLSYPL